MAPNITITKVDDSGGATLQPGDTIRYTITITNTGDMDATNTILTDLIDANTTLTDGTLDVTPIARNDSYTVDVGAEIMTGAGSGVLEGNDSDPDGGSLLVSAVQGSSSNVGNQATTNQGGTITMLANGGFNYIPPSGFSGTDTFEYTVTDDEGDTDTAIVSILVGQINDAPVALDDTASTDEDTAVMGNAIDGSNGGEDIDVDDDVLTVTSNTDPANGTVAISGDGNFTYTPNPDFNGSDSFTYTISDGNGGTDTATVNITVNAVNDAPVNTVPGAQVTDDATPLTFNTIEVSDVDGDSGLVQSTLTVDFGTLTVATGSGATVAGDGSDTVTITGTLAEINAALNGLEYDPSGTSGNATITLTTDDQGNTGSGSALSDTDAIAVSVTSTVNPPAAEDDAFNVTGNVGIDVDSTGSIFLNDSGGTSDSISFGATAGTATTAANGTNTITTSNGGTVLLNADGTFTYDPAAGFEGNDSFFYTLSNAGGSDTAEVTFTVSDLIWFIDDSAGGTSDGTLANPFTSVAAFNAVNNGTGDNPATGDDIFLASGTYSGNTTLLNNQTLIGKGETGTLDGLLGITLPTFSNSLPTLGGADPVVNGNIILASDNTVRGFTLNGGMSGTNVGTLSVRDMNINSGAIEGLDIDAVSGSNVADIEVVDSTFTGEAIRVESVGAARYDLDVIDNTFTNVTNDIRAIVTGSGGVHDINYIGNTSTNSNNNSGGDFVIQMLNGADVTFDIQGNNIQLGAQLLSGDAIQVVGDGNAEGRIGGASASDGNTIDGAGGDGIRLDMGGSSSQSAGNINWTILIQNNDIGATNGVADEGIQILSDNHSGTFNLTVEDNTIANTVEQGLQLFLGNEVGGSGGTIFARVANNTFTNIPDSEETILVQTLENVTLNLDLQGNDGNSLDGSSDADEIELDEFGSSVFRLEQTSTANLSAINNGASVELDSSITNFNVPVTPTLPANLLLVDRQAPSIDISQSSTSTVLTDADLAFIADAAIDRWVQTGLSTTQIETLESITFEVADLPNWYLGAATGTNIQIDTDAFGWGWFVDSTPLDDSEFSTVLSPTYTQADSSSPAHGQIDLLTTVMHEMGHVLGLPDLRGVGTLGELMNSTLAPSTRRTPTVGLADGVTSHSDEDTDYLTSPLDLGTLNEDQVVTVEFEVTVNDPLPAGITTVTNTATVTADGSINEMAAVSTAVECFLTGTLILTNEGEKAVETLKIGDSIQTTDGTLEPIKWIGRQTREPGQVCNPLRSYPIWVKAGALGNGLPHRDLYLSPDHALLVEGLLINAGALVNGTSIIKTEPTQTFTYYHIELDKHALLVAEGTAAESYLPQTEDRLAYDNAAEYDELYPHDCKIILWPLDYPRVSSYVKVPRYIRKHLKNIAVQLGLIEQSA